MITCKSSINNRKTYPRTTPTDRASTTGGQRQVHVGKGGYGAGATDRTCALVQQGQGETALEQTPQRESVGEDERGEERGGGGGGGGGGGWRGVVSGC